MLGIEDKRNGEEEKEWGSEREEGKLGSVITGKLMNVKSSEHREEDKTDRDWRVARHETYTEDKENLNDVSDLRQKEL